MSKLALFAYVVLGASLLASSQAVADGPRALCRAGKPLDASAPESRALNQPPTPADLAVYGQVPSPDYCKQPVDSIGSPDFSFDCATNREQNGQTRIRNGVPVSCTCKKICEASQSTSGQLLSCLSESTRESGDEATKSYAALVELSKGMGLDQTFVPNDRAGAKQLIFHTEASSPPVFNVAGVAVDLRQAKWNDSWREAVSKLRSSCLSKGRADCANLDRVANTFAAKVTLTAKSFRLGELLSDSLRGRGANTDDIDYCPAGETSAAKPTAPRTSQSRPAGSGQLERGMTACAKINPTEAGTVSCNEAEALGLEPLIGDLRRIVGTPNDPSGYIDLLRLRAARALVSSHHMVTGAAIAPLPPSCARFGVGLGAADAELSAGESQRYKNSNSAAGLNTTRQAAQRIVQLHREIHDAEAENTNSNCHANSGGGLGACSSTNYKEHEVKAAIERKKHEARLLLEQFPLLSARENITTDPYDVPMAEKFAAASTPDALVIVAEKAKGMISAALKRNLSRICNDDADRNIEKATPGGALGCHQDSSGGIGARGSGNLNVPEACTKTATAGSDSVPWYELVTLPGLTESTLAVPAFARFRGLQECLKLKARDLQHDRQAVSMVVGAACVAGTLTASTLATPAAGALVGIPCAFIFTALAGNDYLHAANTALWIKECEELATVASDKALCSSSDYLRARSEYESAVRDLVVAGVFNVAELGPVLARAGLFGKASEAAARAAELRSGLSELEAASARGDWAEVNRLRDALRVGSRAEAEAALLARGYTAEALKVLGSEELMALHEYEQRLLTLEHNLTDPRNRAALATDREALRKELEEYARSCRR